MKTSAALAGGLAGTITVASLHEALRRVTSDAPRMDQLDIELIRKTLTTLDRNLPNEKELQRWAVAAELLGDTVYYGLAGIGNRKGTWLRGILLGLAAGVSAVVLPKPLGLPEEPSNKTSATRMMTIGLYLIGGVMAAATAQLVDQAESNG